MNIDTKLFSFDIPDNLTGVLGAAKTRGGVVFRLLCEEERSGIVTTVKALKRFPSRNAEGYELIGTLTEPDGSRRYLFAVWGEEGACGEDNEDLYFRLCDRMYKVYKSITPAPGCKWEPAEGML